MGKGGTAGTIQMGDEMPFAITLEREWKNNQPSVGDVAGSCIPAGEYTCKRVNSPRFKNTFEVMDVKNRTNILFHKGNIEDDSRGCILVGEKFDPVLGTQGITASREGFEEFMDILKGETQCRLIIVDDWKTSLN